MAETKRRVKLYALNAERQWDDKGTGHVTCTFVERLKGVSLVVKAETDSALLLESKVQPDTAYQKQQETLIVWSEGENCDLALSFQEKTGCDEIWELICQVQGKDPSVNITQDFMEESDDERFEESARRDRSPELPPCDPERLETISEIISNSLASSIRREKLASLLETESYVKKLLHSFHLCEKSGNVEGLHHLYDIFKNIFLLNKNALFEIMFSDDAIFDVVGCLEYDPNNRTRKKHREYLREMTHFREVIPITNPELLAKIHQTYRVQYIQDVVFPAPSILEENMLSTLSSFIYFNKIEIVSLIQEDEKFLSDLFTQLTDEYIPASKRRDLVLFLKEFVSFSHTLQPQNREIFFKTLMNFGVLPALEITLSSNDPATKSASIDILACVVEFSPSMVRDYIYQEATNSENDEFLVNIIIEQMLCDSDPELGGAVQLSGILRLIIDPDNMLTTINKSEKTEFLNFFYKHSMHLLIAPLLANTKEEISPNEDYHTVQLLGLVLELLSFCVEHHSYHIKNYISNCNRDLVKRVLVLMGSRHMFLALSALRFLRKVISLKDEFYIRHIIKGDLLAPVVQALLRNKGRYNLLDSAILDLFEFIRLEDIQSLYVYIIEAYGDDLAKIQYVQTFKSLQNRYDQNHDHAGSRTRKSLLIEEASTVLRGSRYRRELHSLESDEGWINPEDNDAESKPEISPKKDASPVYPSSSSDSDPDLAPSTSDKSTESKSPVQLKRSLVDYEVCDSDEEEDEEAEGSREEEKTTNHAESELKRIKID